MNKTKIILVAILALNFLLTIIGLKWGLPNRWCVDEQVSNSLKLIASKSIFTVVTNVHPQLYNFFLGGLFLPYLLTKRITGYPLDIVQTLAKISWMEMAYKFENFATDLYLLARFSSVLLGLFTLYLLFRVAKLLHNERAALFATLTLGVSMGFVETNHLAKHTSLAVFFVILVLFLCLKSLKEKKYFRRYFYWACFSCGLAATSKLDGIISILFLPATIMYLLFQEESHKSLKEKMKAFDLKFVMLSGLLFAGGIIVGWPALLVNLGQYLQTRQTQNGIFYGGFPSLNFISMLVILEKIKDNFILLIRNFSLPLSLFVFWGIGSFFKNIKRYPYSLVISSMLLPYLFICLTYFTEYPGTSTKLIVHAMIIFCLFAGKIIDEFLSGIPRTYLLKKMFIASIFIFAVVYTFQADLFFYNRDTRYQSTAWILENIPPDKTIEHYQEAANLFSEVDIPFKYDVIFWGRHSQDYRGKKSLYLRNVQDKLKYKAKLNKEGSRADFFLLALGGEFVMEEPQKGTFLYRLYNGEEKNFKLVKSFEPKSNFFLVPRPEWTAPRIFIYERVN
jgi:hypothetical protein